MFFFKSLSVIIIVINIKASIFLAICLLNQKAIELSNSKRWAFANVATQNYNSHRNSGPALAHAHRCQ